MDFATILKLVESIIPTKILLLIVGMIAAIGVLNWIFKAPFSYPYYEVRIDVSGKKSLDKIDCIDRYLIQRGISEFLRHDEYVQRWKADCRRRISHTLLKGIRSHQFYKCLDNRNTFQFIFTRSQTRYRQINYKKYSYRVTVEDDGFSADLAWLNKRYNELKQINFECTLKEYYSRNQRSLMTKALRDEIAARDHYTCRICGKYMPDGVGLQIDHVIPIAKGGKSVPSNLQVLCSKCNGRKSDSLRE